MPTPSLINRDGTYYAVWSESRRSKRKSMGTKDRAVAEQRFAQWLLLGGHRDNTPNDLRAALTAAELWAVYEEKHVKTEMAAPRTADYSWRNLKAHFGDMTVDAVDQTSVDDYVYKRTTGAVGVRSVPGTVRRELAALRAMFNWHAHSARGKKRLLEKADVPAFSLPGDSAPRERWLTKVEIEKLLQASAPAEGERLSRGHRFLWLALETAARKQAILDLTWDRVDFETGVVHYAVPGRKTTKKRRVSVPISKRLLPVLERAKVEATGPHVLDHSGDVWAAIQAIVIRAGLAPAQRRTSSTKPKGTGISPHTLRHTAATHMARRGVPLYDIAGVLGNTLAVVEKTYAHHCPDRLRSAVDSISGQEDRA